MTALRKAFKKSQEKVTALVEEKAKSSKATMDSNQKLMESKMVNVESKMDNNQKLMESKIDKKFESMFEEMKRLHTLLANIESKQTPSEQHLQLQQEH